MAAKRSQFAPPRRRADLNERALAERLAKAEADELSLRPPPTRPGMVDRAALVGRLIASRENRVVTIVAPAGWGKTTLLTQWLLREARPVAWVSIDRSDNDPATLLALIVAALRRAGMATEETLKERRVTSDLVISFGVPHVVNVLRSQATAGVMMLDNVESIHSRASHDVIAELAARLPDTVQLVVASRRSVRLPISVLRTQGVLLELTASDLAMDSADARTVLEGMGVEVGDNIGELMSRTEGWPAGIYLAGLATKSGSPRQLPLQAGGEDRFVADYLRSEILDHLSDASISFLTRTSVLERFCGPLCDAILGTTGSARTIERLEQRNLLVVPLDRTRDWYRYHLLLRDFLYAELRHREPDAIAGLHARAAQWFDSNAMPELAISHAFAADDLHLAARIMCRVMRVTYGLGRADTVFDWMRRFEHSDKIADYPAVAAMGAIIYALSGDEAAAEQWTSLVAADDVVANEHLPTPAYILRALLMREGTAQVRTDARTARVSTSAEPEWLASALGLEGYSYLWDGETERADSLFARAAAAGEWFSGLPAATNALAARAGIAIGRDDWEAAGKHADRALELIREHGLELYLTSGIAFAVAARCAVRRNKIGEARGLLAQATAIRPRLSNATPGLSVQTLLEMTKAHVELGDIAGARLVMRETSDIVVRHRDLRLLSSQYEELKIRLQEQATTAVGALVLTSAELRLLPYLTTHLSFPEIGERLFISRHTVKTQAMSIYRKLGASSRSEAVRRARDVGLVTA